MISFLEGNVVHIGEKHLVLDVNGVGYRVHIPDKIQKSIANKGEKIKLFTRLNLNVRDGSFDIYGFENPGDLGFFDLLTSVKGIGSKMAMQVLSVADIDGIRAAIARSDEDYLHKVAGIGVKTAQRLIVELRTKIDHIDLKDYKDSHMSSDAEAIEALLALGYSRYQAQSAVKQIDQKDQIVEDKVKEALKILGNR